MKCDVESSPLVTESRAVDDDNGGRHSARDRNRPFGNQFPFISPPNFCDDHRASPYNSRISMFLLLALALAGLISIFSIVSHLNALYLCKKDGITLHCPRGDCPLCLYHPDGDCPLCLYPLLPEDKEHKILPFMKLMSCFHCFHRYGSECIIRWWNWLQKEKESPGKMDDHKEPEESTGSCPVCRKIFQASDLNHVLGLVGSHSSKLVKESPSLWENPYSATTSWKPCAERRRGGISDLPNENGTNGYIFIHAEGI